MNSSKILIKDETKQTLKSMKLYPGETYENVIERMIEDIGELSDKSKVEIEEVRKETETGNFVTNKQLKRDLDL